MADSVAIWLADDAIQLTHSIAIELILSDEKRSFPPDDNTQHIVCLCKCKQQKQSHNTFGRIPNSNVPDNVCVCALVLLPTGKPPTG